LLEAVCDLSVVITKLLETSLLPSGIRLCVSSQPGFDESINESDPLEIVPLAFFDKTEKPEDWAIDAK